MLHVSQPLYFPSLHRFGETSFKSWSESDDSTGLYTLDWDKTDKTKKDSFLKWSKAFRTSDMKFPGTLPEEYDEWVKQLTFAIPGHYLKEIRSNAYKALIEWSTERHFDTSIREMCLTPAIGHTYVAFALIADCLYDAATNYFSRDPKKTIVKQVMLYKFWALQTGRGCVRDHAGFDKIEWLVKADRRFSDDATKLQVKLFFKAVDAYEKELEKVYAVVAMETGPVKAGEEAKGCDDPAVAKPVEMEPEVVERKNVLGSLLNQKDL